MLKKTQQDLLRMKGDAIQALAINNRHAEVGRPMTQTIKMTVYGNTYEFIVDDEVFDGIRQMIEQITWTTSN